ncbi:hypothetical protein E2C01_075321 [Portunus trituberculatus]|uniref:Uncharacterized protein n=1 Tax=Portunus trituberculatus TaxID=210409 RepID=A0A5B7IEP3_PORTR|nr:hypothetical protein [Portunus trituberculatus]
MRHCLCGQLAGDLEEPIARPPWRTLAALAGGGGLRAVRAARHPSLRGMGVAQIFDKPVILLMTSNRRGTTQTQARPTGWNIMCGPQGLVLARWLTRPVPPRHSAIWAPLQAVLTTPLLPQPPPGALLLPPVFSSVVRTE